MACVRALLLSVLVAASTPANAALITGSFNGTLTSGYYGAGVPVSGSFSIDTTLLPPNQCTAPGQGCYTVIDAGSPYTTINVTVLGTTTTFGSPYEYVGDVEIRNYYNLFPDAYDFFGVTASSDQFSTYYATIGAYAFRDWFAGVAPPTALYYQPETRDDRATGYFQFPVNIGGGQFSEATASFTISSLTIPAQVPEPSSLSIVATAFLMLVVATHRWRFSRH